MARHYAPILATMEDAREALACISVAIDDPYAENWEADGKSLLDHTVVIEEYTNGAWGPFRHEFVIFYCWWDGTAAGAWSDPDSATPTQVEVSTNSFGVAHAYWMGFAPAESKDLYLSVQGRGRALTISNVGQILWHRDGNHTYIVRPKNLDQHYPVSVNGSDTCPVKFDGQRGSVVGGGNYRIYGYIPQPNAEAGAVPDWSGFQLYD